MTDNVEQPQAEQVNEGLSVEEIRDARKRLSELEDKLKKVDELENKQIEALKKLTNCEMEFKIKELQNKVKGKMDDRMSHVEERYEEHTIKSIGGIQTDILRMNKVIREISRKLPADSWHAIYDFLTSDIEDRIVVGNERDRIEQARPFMQAYMCLTSWRDQCGDKCDISRITVALRSNDHEELAKISEEILSSTGDSLFTFNGVCRKTKVKGERAPRPMSVVLSNLEDLEVSKPSALRRKPSLRVQNEKIEGFLGNRILLKISRTFKTHDQWRLLARRLGFTEEAIEDVDSNDDDSNTCTFKMLYQWRDSIKPLKAEHVKTLETQLIKIEQQDAVTALNA